MATIDASVTKDPIKPEKEVICAMETFSTVYRAKIECYTQVKHCSRDFRIDCGTFDLAGYRWAISYYPTYMHIHSKDQEAALHIRLLTDTNTSLTLGGQISLIDPSGRPSSVGYVRGEYNKQDNGHKMPIMQKTKLDSSEYVKDGCLSFECLVSVTKWSPAEVVKETRQSAITTSKFWEDLSRHMESGKGEDVSFEVCNDTKKPNN